MRAFASWLARLGACGIGAVCAAAPVSAQTACADLAGATFGNGVVLEPGCRLRPLHPRRDEGVPGGLCDNSDPGGSGT